MHRTKNLDGRCGECGRILSFPADLVGTTAQCPMCGRETELQLELPELPPTLPRRTLVWTLIAALILGGGLVGSYFALKKARGLVERLPQKSSRP